MKSILTGKRIGGLLGAVVLVTSLGSTPAVAGPTYDGSKTYYDKVGDVRARADIRRTTVTATDGAVWATTRISDLTGVGRYRVYIEDYPDDPRGHKIRVVVTKQAGQVPVARMLEWNYGDDVWVRTPCSMVVGWDVSTNIVKVQIPRRCSGYLQGPYFSVKSADFTYGGVTDRITLDRRTGW